MSKLRTWICLSVVMALMLTVGLLTMAGTPGLVQADVDPVVIFPDPNLEAAIREAIDKPIGDIYQSDLEELVGLYAPARNIVNLTGLESCTSLTALLQLGGNQISDISPLAGLTSLTNLELSENQISDISSVGNLTSLTVLLLGGNLISDISPLVNLISLTNLGLWENQISDISPLADLTSLTGLELWQNPISDISPLADLTSLTGLTLGYNQISDISPLANLTSLRVLWLYFNQISDISPLANLTGLEVLYLRHNQISDIKPLVDNPWLGEGDLVDLGNNPLSDTSLNIYIPLLQARGVDVSYGNVPPSGCFIATAAYGTPMAEEIQILRDFRDEYLLTNPLGQAFVDIYYSISPPIANFITEHPSLRPVVRIGLLPAVAISTIAVNTTLTEKTAIVGLLVLVSVAVAIWSTKRRGRGQRYI